MTAKSSTSRKRTNITPEYNAVPSDNTRSKKQKKDSRCRALQTTPRWDLLKDKTEPLAVDVEFQEYRPMGVEKWAHRIGRVGVTNTRGERIYDVYARYPFVEGVEVKLPPARFGVEWPDLRIQNGAKWASEVNQTLKEIFAGRTIVGHGMRLDRKAIDDTVWESVDQIVDTQSQSMYGWYDRNGLKNVACCVLGLLIQDSLHDPIEDAKATMLLYLRLRPFKGRKSFEDPPPAIDDEEEFPSLASSNKRVLRSTKRK